MGLGSMVGTGVFVSIGIAAGVAGGAVLPAIVIAALVALCNALSSAQLAAAHPVSGGTYEYGYVFLKPWVGFCSGWMFLFAKSASAATAALGFSGYLLNALGLDLPVQIPAMIIIAVITALLLSGMKRTNLVNTIIVSATLISLFIFAGVALTQAPQGQFPLFSDMKREGFLYGCALMFVAYTGYGRVATLGEEVKDPRKTIPKAIVAVMAVTAFLYILIGSSALLAVGPERYGELTTETAAPLEGILNELNQHTAAKILSLGALTAMLGVLLNLILGLSRVLLAMGRRGDMPAFFAKVQGGSPKVAEITMAVVVALIALPGNLKLAWSFSAFTVLVYYSITNLCALQLKGEQRLYPRIFSYGGLASCAFLAFMVPWQIWCSGLGLIALGLGWHLLQVRKDSHEVNQKS